MVDKIVILLSVGLSVVILTFASKPNMQTNSNNELLFSNPYIFKAISNISHTLLADKLWLMSTDLGEIKQGGSHKVIVDDFYNASKTITVMDPYFFPAINYFATYLSSIHQETQMSIDLYETARLYDKNNFLLYFNEILLRATYQEPIDDDAIVRLAKKAFVMPQKRKYFGKRDLSNMVEGFIVFARNKKDKKDKIRDDLTWLLKNSENEKIKKKIKKRLNAMDLEH